MGKYAKDDHKVICPFFRTQALKSISCEGLTEGTVTMTRFPEPELKESHVENVCCTWDYGSCRVASVLSAKYDENGNLIECDLKMAESGFAKSENGIGGCE